jgi:type IV pilus assembly protein PilP
MVISVCSFALAACSGDADDLQKYVQDVKARKSKQIEPIPQMKPYEAFAYVPGTRRDPFVPGAPAGASSGVRPDLNRSKEPLEEYPLDGLKLVGAVTYKGRQYAMIKAPDGVIHRVTIGDHMGQNYGKIIKVSEAEVSLIEIIPDGFGGFTERPSSLAAE